MCNFTCPRTCPLAGERWCRFGPILDKMGPARANSHTVTVKVEYLDPEVMRLAVLGMGGQWYGPGHYDLGDTQQDGYGFRLPMPTGGFAFDDQGNRMEGLSASYQGKCYWYHPLVLRYDGELAYDAYGGVFGDQMQIPKLKEAYTIALAEKAAQEQGWLYERQADGSLLIYHPKGGTLTVTANGVVDANGFHGQGCHEAIEQLAMGQWAQVTAKPEYTQVQAEVCIPGGR